MSTVVPELDPGADLALWTTTGDRSALERALVPAADMAYSQALRLLGRAADADDVTQEALVQLVRSAHRYQPQRPFRPWLARLVHDACCRFLRSRRRRRHHEGVTAMPVAAPETSIDPEQVRAAVVTLPEPLRAAIELHYFAGLSQGEAAGALGIREGACAMRLSRARDRLRVLLGGRHAELLSAVALPMGASGHATVAKIAGQIAAKAAAGTLPATTIPLSFMQFGAWFMTTHPLITVLLALGISSAILAPFALSAADAPPVAAAIVQPTISAPARVLLPYLDPSASLRLAIDLETLRPQLMQTPLFSLLTDPQMAPTMQLLEQQSQAWIDQEPSDDLKARKRLLVVTVREMLAHGRALTLAINDRSRRTYVSADVPSLLATVDMGSGAPVVAERCSAVQPIASEITRRQIGPFAEQSNLDNDLFTGRDHERFALATASWLKARIVATPAPVPPSPLWFRYDAASLLQSYLSLAGNQDDPANISALLGPHWKTMTPLIDGTLTVAGGQMISSVQVSGAGKMSPLMPLVVIAGGTAMLPLGDLANCPLRRPTMGVPTSADRVASFSMALTMPDPMQPFTKAITSEQIPAGSPAQDPVIAMLRSAWSGDLALELRPGSPMPKGALVLGIRPGVSTIEAARQFAVYLQASQAPLDQPGALPKTISAQTPAGQLNVTAFTDRLVLTCNGDLADWPGIGSAAAAALAPDCSLLVDLPAIVRTWGQLAMFVLPPQQSRLLPPLPLLIAHLPLWRMTWEGTADGCRISEQGLPLAAALVAGAVFREACGADPLREVQPNQGQIQIIGPPVIRPVKPPATF